jgi:hypothetical protein
MGVGLYPGPKFEIHADISKKNFARWSIKRDYRQSVWDLSVF